ncbi:MAG TPA: hypothetical protein VLM88_06980 [Proteiniclasticum sp.]|nr:hypothetical protein [Proteiniclasticum sp.]
MKAIIGVAVMILFMFAMTIGGELSANIFGVYVGEGVVESNLYPIYAGIVLLAGLITICTVVILEKIERLNDTLNKNKKEDESKQS